MRQIRHPLSDATYELDDGDVILVSKDGATGRFTPDGRWLGGDIRSADPELCRWIGSGSRGAAASGASRRYARPAAATPTGDDTP
jgi:hypothetical protein